MKLDHINLTVSDVARTSAFLKKHFGYRDMFEDNNAGIAVLEDGSDMHINLMKGSKISYPKNFHIGFDLETEENVNKLYERLVADGIKISKPKHVAWGSYTSNFLCPGGDFSIEIACASE